MCWSEASRRRIRVLGTLWLFSVMPVVSSLADSPSALAPGDAATATPAPPANLQEVLSTDDPTAYKPRRKKRVVTGVHPWLGKFVGLRGGLSGGEILVPYSDAGTSSSSSFIDTSLVLGAEIGYCERHWGASFSFDFAPIGLFGPTYLSGGPMHWVLAANLNYIPSDKLRWILGLEPYQAYRGSLVGGGTLGLTGVGLRVGGHMRLSEQDSRVWEAFALGSFGTFRTTELNSDTSSVGVSGAGSGFFGYFTLLAGVQWTFVL